MEFLISILKLTKAQPCNIKEEMSIRKNSPLHTKRALIPNTLNKNPHQTLSVHSVGLAETCLGQLNTYARQSLVTKVKQQEQIIGDLEAMILAYKEKVEQFQKYEHMIGNFQQLLSNREKEHKQKIQRMKINKVLTNICQPQHQRSQLQGDIKYKGGLSFCYCYSLSLYQQNINSRQSQKRSAPQNPTKQSPQAFSESETFIKQIKPIHFSFQDQDKDRNVGKTQENTKRNIRQNVTTNSNRSYFINRTKKQLNYFDENSIFSHNDPNNGDKELRGMQKLLKNRHAKQMSYNKQNYDSNSIDLATTFNFSHMAHPNQASFCSSKPQKSFTCTRSPSLENLKRIKNCLNLLKN